MTNNKFSGLNLADPIQRALDARNHVEPTPIQARAIPELLAGKDLLGIAQTGTGKTAAFALPILDRLSRGHGNKDRRLPRALILAPTRELAIQIGEEIRAYAIYLHLRQMVIFGGVGQKPQVSALRRGVDIVVATPGRLLDLMDQGWVRLGSVEVLVLDEADRMLDMGFVRDVRKIIGALPADRQSLLFSATMPTEVTRLSRNILTNPVTVEVTPRATPVARVEQQVYHVGAREKLALLTGILEKPALSRVLVFSRTKHRANRITEKLGKAGVSVAVIHGNKSQSTRQRALKRFREGQVRVLVATDIAARGIDVEGVTHVVNFDLPNEPESYVHRIGRTARAGAGGIALSFCDPTERAYLSSIERLIRNRLTVAGDSVPPALPNKAEMAGKPAQPNKAEMAGKHSRRTRRKGGARNQRPERAAAANSGAMRFPRDLPASA